MMGLSVIVLSLALLLTAITSPEGAKLDLQKKNLRRVCPKRFPIIEIHSDKKEHGDVCRKSSQNKNYRCPKGCFKTPKGGRPFCQMSPSNKAPCRLVCEDNFPRLKVFSDPSEHGNVCRKQNDNNYRCPRGCRKTPNGLVPFCSTRKNPSKPCRKQ